MIRKDRAAAPGKVGVTFELPATLWAGQVAVVGEFNGWDPNAGLLARDADGAWRLSLQLDRGHRYSFLYLLDGREWLDEPWADGHIPTRSGGALAVVET